jgi:hypothetical protein
MADPVPVPAPDPFKLAVVYLFAIDNTAIAVQPKSPCLDGVRATLNGSLNLIRTQILFPAILGDFAIRVQHYADRAELEISGKLRDEREDQNPQEIEIANRVIQFFAARELQLKTDLKEPNQWKDFIRNRITMGATPSMFLSKSTMGANGVKAYYASLVTTTWTTFEILAGDLWEATLNGHPKILAELRGSRKRLFRSGSDEEPAWEDQDDPLSKDIRTVPLQEILRHEFRIEDKMGSVLRTRRRFDHLAGIKEAYALAFSRKSENIDAILRQNAFEALNAVRNLIVHRAGIVDDTYDKKSKYLPIPSAPKGTLIWTAK